MTAPARLLALRLHGFKSFAERTSVEFGPGISAIVGPNGSGKSNLADALRWALGEQGRALRSRKAEDVIWAGSDKRAAVGMADVTLMLDNTDGLLPVEYAAIELGRRLFRSGENDYLLNRQRVRLRELIDLLDAANLADNAFLFIGQGMVDQALALRPEERRPLFEEVAGVRRHERRRRKAEDQLTESEANLARLQDILAELRPQARRLAVQAEQQTTRATAGADLADALLLAAHARWHAAATRQAAAGVARTTAAAEASTAETEAREAETALAEIGTELRGRLTDEAELRSRHDAARSVLTELQLHDARLATENEALVRDRARLLDERASAEADLAVQRRTLALGVPDRDAEAETRPREAERALAEALAELARLQVTDRDHDEAAALRRAIATREADAETARRRVAEAERRLAEQADRAASLRDRELELAARLAAATESRTTALAAEEAAQAALLRARTAVERAERRGREASQRNADAAATLAEVTARIAALRGRVDDEDAAAFVAAAARHGGRSVADGVEIEPDLVAAVDAALGPVGRGVVLVRSVIGSLRAERGIAVVDEAVATTEPTEQDSAFLATVIAGGGGGLGVAVRRDPSGAARALLIRAAWLPTLDACLGLQSQAPPGWVLVLRDGSCVVTGQSVRFLPGEGTMRVQAELEQALRAQDRVEHEARAAERDLSGADHARATAAEEMEAARAAESEAARARRRAEDEERVAERDLEATARERAWSEAQRERLATERDRARTALAATAPDADTASRTETDTQRTEPIAAWQARVDGLRRERDRVAADHAASDASRREAETRHARAEAAAALDEERISRADRDAATLAERAEQLASERSRVSAELTIAFEREGRERAALEALLADETAVRERLSGAEQRATAARERVRRADESLRAADHAELEARLAVEGLREQVLVELVGLGDLALEHMQRLTPTSPLPAARGNADDRDDEDGSDSDARVFETALDAVASMWSATAPTDEPPSAARLATLRRRYHELGAANPFAVEEYAELRARLEALEVQEEDLRTAIAGTRELIEELNGLIAEQFTTTFRALEAAFDRRFNQLFGGGYARLALTEPSDLSQTGVEIIARPPGKKAQALAMLSGGERALTAVALLFAMLEVRPVPFCVLDEVDAALDEANVGRFSTALRGLAKQTQFIVITHNRGTIEVADALYGITVGEDSVSRMISLRLDEAQALAEQTGRAAPAAETAAAIG